MASRPAPQTRSADERKRRGSLSSLALDAPSHQMNREVRSPDLSDARGGDRGACERFVESGLRAERSLDSEHENVGQPGCDQFAA